MKVLNTIIHAGVLGLSIACSSSSSTEGQSASNAIIPLDQDYAVLEKGSSSSFKAQSTFVIRTTEEWENHYSRHMGDTLTRTAAPPINFNQEDLVAIHLGARPNPGYSVVLSTVSYDTTDNTNQVRFYELIDNNTIWPEVISHPYTFIRVPKSDLEYRFIQNPTVNLP